MFRDVSAYSIVYGANVSYIYGKKFPRELHPNLCPTGWPSWSWSRIEMYLKNENVRLS